ncbi:hypothetical protein BOTBODRAFT_182539 [Botryobasidium botryosum FD-172 SS1]|uniref:DUF6532 domain-containing protein n=1 Tax=Botryobasidium botryosum (strain FD-172 SS1) TaxID=930990 RepID=A0A067LQJ3_BOTB1|nr:hypothetical protein BOTBODRAFT_182539 [Botryobasidium botryosum FD-172 SS1]
MYNGVIVFPRIPGPTLPLTSAAAYTLAEYSTGAHINAKFLQTTHSDTYKKHALTLDHIHMNTIVPMTGGKHVSSNDQDDGILTLPVRFNVMEK